MRELWVLAAIVAGLNYPSAAVANECDGRATVVARAIGASVTAPASRVGMVSLAHPRGGEITFGCPDRHSGGFLAIFARSGGSLDDFVDFVGSVGEALTRQPRAGFSSSARACIADAKAKGGFARRAVGTVTLDCGGGLNGSNPKVTIEFER